MIKSILRTFEKLLNGWPDTILISTMISSVIVIILIALCLRHDHGTMWTWQGATLKLLVLAWVLFP